MEYSQEIEVGLSGGFHARPVSEIVKLARQFKSEIFVLSGSKSASARSSLKLIMLGVKEHDTVTISAVGEDASLATEALVSLVGEPAAPSRKAAQDDRETAQPVDEDTDCLIRGVPGGGGKALGPAFYFSQPEIDKFSKPEAGPAIELQKAKEAFSIVVGRLRKQAEETPNQTSRMIMDAIAEIAQDEEWNLRIAQEINAGLSAARAVFETSEMITDELEAMEDEYFRARAEDIASLGRLVVLQLQGRKPARLEAAPEGAIVIADDIGAAEAGAVDLDRLAGLVIRHGSPTSHTAILARSAGLAAVFGVNIEADSMATADQIALDGDTGAVHINPDQSLCDTYRNEIKAAHIRLQALQDLVPVRPRTASGETITVAANLENISEISRAKAAGAMGVGLFRTEFLFMGSPELPTEEFQYSQYRTLAEAFDDPVVFRTLDIGADKPARCLPAVSEVNPALGLRGIRLCLAHPEMFKTQLRALLRAAVHGPVHIMIPMITDVGEILKTRDLIEQAARELEAEGMPFAIPPLGVMIETPAAVFTARDLARHVDFFSIGTNDLTQYVMAADRMNIAVSSIADPGHPAVLEAIRQVCDAARGADIWVGVCGEAAGDPGLAEKFIALGVRELSMAPSRILEMKASIQD